MGDENASRKLMPDSDNCIVCVQNDGNNSNFIVPGTTVCSICNVTSNGKIQFLKQSEVRLVLVVTHFSCSGRDRS